MSFGFIQIHRNVFGVMDHFFLVNLLEKEKDECMRFLKKCHCSEPYQVPKTNQGHLSKQDTGEHLRLQANQKTRMFHLSGENNIWTLSVSSIFATRF